MKKDEAITNAVALFGAGNLDGARAACEAILAADPRHFVALHLGAAVALTRNDLDECIALATRALEVDPGNVEVLCNRGAALRRLNRVPEALADYERAARGAPNSARVFLNRGVALAALNRHTEAIVSYSRAVALDPNEHSARFNRSLSRLVTGDFRYGWDDWESRWGSGTQGAPPSGSQPVWDGNASLEGKTLLVQTEQGLGDSIQFSRYASLLKARGASVILEAQPVLKDLLAQVPGVERVVVPGESVAADLRCPLMSLPRLLGTRLETIPADIPYLCAPPAHVERWKDRMPPRTGARIGIAWSGRPTLMNDRNRTIPLAAFAPLRRTGAALVSLQAEIRVGDRAAFESGGPIVHFGPGLGDFRDTAALVELVDRVITVDTAAAHLAGAMGKPVWLLLPFAPDWRWLLGRDTSPWYPTMRIFRQPRVGDWESVIERVARESAAA